MKKRLFVLGALLAGAASLPAAGAKSFSSDVQWLPSSTSGWGKHAQAGHHDDLVEDRSVNGKPAFPNVTTRVSLHKGDRFAGSPRSEWRPTPDLRQSEGEQYWLGWFVYLPPGSPKPGNWGRMLVQMHGGPAGYQPSWGLRESTSGALYLDVRGGARNANLRSRTVLPTLTRGEVHEIKVFVRASSKSDGVIKVFVDGQQRAEVTGPNKYVGQSGYLKFGLYGSDVPGQAWMGGWIKSRSEADIDLMHSMYKG